jgi:uncharacterized membrane protein YhaH (DUF805 family)
MHMKKALRPIPWFSGGLATLAALLIVAIALPNMGKVIVDNSVSPPHVYAQSDPLASVVFSLVAFLPVLSIFILGRRWIFFDRLGWFVLVCLPHRCIFEMMLT